MNNYPAENTEFLCVSGFILMIPECLNEIQIKGISSQDFYHLKTFYPIKVVNRLYLGEEINVFRFIHSLPTIPGTVLYLFSAGEQWGPPPDSTFQGDYVCRWQNKAEETTW